MKERPILFSGAMVRAILAGQKTQTRRIVKPQPSIEGQTPRRTYPYGFTGDRLWVRETFARDVPGCEAQGGVSYRADHNDPRGDGPANPMRWTPAIHMPRALSRIDLEIDAVRVERLHDITEEDSRAEGVSRDNVPGMLPRSAALAAQARAIINGSMRTTVDPTVWPIARDHRDLFMLAWTALNGDKVPWASNPWVWVVSFRRVRP